MGGGSQTAKNQLNEQNQLQQQSFNAQMAELNSLKSSLSPYLSGTLGFTPGQLAMLNSQAINQNAAKYNQAGNAVRANLEARGMNGQAPMGGAGVQGIATLEGAKASDLSNSLNTVGLNNAQQALSNQFNAASILSGNAQTMGMNNSVFGQGAGNALSNYIQSQNNGFLGGFGRSLGGTLAGGLGSGLVGGLGAQLATVGNGNFGW